MLQNPEDLIGKHYLLDQLTKHLLEQALDGELTHHHLDDEKNSLFNEKEKPFD